MGLFKKLFGGGEKETCEGCGNRFPKEELLTIRTMSPDGSSSAKRLCKKCKVSHILGMAGR